MAVKFYGKAESAANQILAAFQNPEQLPKALAPVFIHRKDDVPCRKWSWNNQLICALRGHGDARGYRQWQQVGRHVRKGEKSFAILAPVKVPVEREDRQTGEKKTATAIVGFKSTAVFGLSQTEGEPVEVDEAAERWLDDLPLVDVAREWGLSVQSYNGQRDAALGKYSRRVSIAVGVENLATWAHELTHAADDRLGKLTERGQHWRSETVAELGASTLLSILGMDADADLGGCWEYVSAYAREAKLEPIVACQRVLTRTCDAVALILDTAESLKRDAGQTVKSQPTTEPAECQLANQ